MRRWPTYGAGGGATVCAIGMVLLVDAPDQCVQREPGQLVEIDGDGAQRGGGVRTFGDAVEPDDSDVCRRAQAEIGQPAHDVERDVMVFSKHPMSNATRDRYAGKVLRHRRGIVSALMPKPARSSSP